MSDEKAQDMRIFTSDVRQPSEKKAAQPLLGNPSATLGRMLASPLMAALEQ